MEFYVILGFFELQSDLIAASIDQQLSLLKIGLLQPLCIA